MIKDEKCWRPIDLIQVVISGYGCEEESEL